MGSARPAPQALRFHPEQRFTCAQCGNCCRGWDVIVTEAEAERYRAARAERWYREQGADAEGAASDPFQHGPRGTYVIRRREDGTCGFLSPQTLCRIHEEMGGPQKPLACRVFPFRVHPTEHGTVVTTSGSCPTIVANRGEQLGSQARDVKRIAGEWERTHPEPALRVCLADTRALPAAALDTIRDVSRTLLDRPQADGTLDLRDNLRCLARWLEDLTRHRVVRLADDALCEYIQITGTHAAGTRATDSRRLSATARLRFRGVLLTAVAARAQRKDAGGMRLRLRLTRLVAHLHGLWPATPELDLRAARRNVVDVNAPELQPLVRDALRSAAATLGSGRRAVVDEMALGVAIVNAACVFAAARGDGPVSAARLTDALVQTSELGHADGGMLSPLLTSFAAGVESLYLFASGRPI